MSIETIKCAEQVSAAVVRNGSNQEAVDLSGKYQVTCHDSDGNLKWADKIENLITTVGKNNILNVYLGASTQTTTWYFGLIAANGYSTILAADHMNVHAGWREAANGGNNPQYSQSTRPSAAWSAAAAGSKATSAASAFTISTTGTCKGAFLVSTAVKGSNTGVLYSAGLFTAGDKAVQASDVINVSYTATAS